MNQEKFETFIKLAGLLLRDNYRQEKRGNADKEKIRLIEEYLRR